LHRFNLKTMVKTLLKNPDYQIESDIPVTFDLQTPVNQLAENKTLKITFTVPYRTP